jgi:photosystem II stability/assembly factor-like uncharacterized protein
MRLERSGFPLKSGLNMPEQKRYRWTEQNFYVCLSCDLLAAFTGADEVTDWNRIMLDSLLVQPAVIALKYRGWRNMLQRKGRASCINVVVMLLWLSGHAFAQGLTEPVTVSRVGPEAGRVSSIVIDPQDSKKVYAASDTGVFKSTDGGTTWSYSGLMGSSVSSIAIVPQSPTTVYASAPGNIFKSLDAGATWNQVPGTPRNLILDAIDPQGILFGRIRPSGGLFKSSDGGTTWQQAGVGIPMATVLGLLGPLAIDPRNANTLYIAGHPINVDFPFVTLFKSTNGGATWSQIAPGISISAALGLTIDPSNTSTLYMTTETGFIKSTDGGRSWNSINNGLTECFCTRGPLVIDPQNTATLYAMRFDGIIFKSTNGGRSWAIISGNFPANSLTVDPRDSNTLYAANAFGAFKSTDGGVSWNGINSDLRSTPILSAVIDPQSPDTLYAATRFYGVSKSIDRGKTWVASSSGIKLQSTTETLAIDPQTPNILYAGTEGNECEYPGGVFKSVDAGVSWADTGLVSCLHALAIDPQIPSTIYAETDDNGVVKSIDGGGSWNPINAGLPARSVTALAIDPQNPQILYAAAGALFKSTDGGMSWNSTGLSVDRSFISGVTIDAQNPGTVYAVITPFANNGGSIWKSVDGGTSWQDLSSALPSVPHTIALDPKNSATIYAGTDLGVITSANGGESWMLLTSATGSTQLLIPAPDSTLYAGGPGGLFAISLPPTVTAVTLDVSIVRAGGSYTATVMGSNLNNNTYIDVQVRAPGSAEDIVVLNWQMGTSESHSVPAGVLPGAWIIDGVRPHQDPENHAGTFAQVSAVITVSP